MSFVHRLYSAAIAVCIAGAAVFLIVLKLNIPAHERVFGDAISLREVPYTGAGGVGTIHVARIPRTHVAVAIEHDENHPRFISEWGSMVTSSVVINGSYFDQNFQPAGYVIVGGIRIGTHMFDQDKSGLITITSGTLRIRDLSVQPVHADERFDFALQSYPFLIRNHAAAIDSDSGKHARRSAIALDDFGNIFLLVADTSDLSLFEFMNVIKRMPYDFASVLNLDGGPSTGISIHHTDGNFDINSESVIPHILRFKLQG